MLKVELPKSVTTNSDMSNRKKLICDEKYDIIEIDKKIKSLIDNQTDHLLDYKKELEALSNSNKSTNHLSFQKRNHLNKTINDLRNKIDKLESNFMMTEYVFETANLIENYKKIIDIPTQHAFIKIKPNTNKDSQTNHNNAKNKQSIFSQFMSVAQNYLLLDNNIVNSTEHNFVEHDDQSSFHCECDSSINFRNNENSIVCTKCGTEYDLMTHQASFNDITRVNMSVKYKYERPSHFKDAVYQFQGKQNKKINPIVYQDLENEFRKHNLLIKDFDSDSEISPSSSYRKNKFKYGLGKYANISKRHVSMFLKETGHNKHYEDVNLIGKAFGIATYDLTSIEQNLFEDFQQILNAYETLKNNERANFLNNQYVLFQLLKKRDFECDKDDFNLIESKERLREHDSIYQQICRILHWKFTAIG